MCIFIETGDFQAVCLFCIQLVLINSKVPQTNHLPGNWNLLQPGYSNPVTVTTTFLLPGYWPESSIQDPEPRSWTLDQGCWTLDPGSRMLDPRVTNWIKHPGSKFPGYS